MSTVSFSHTLCLTLYFSRLVSLAVYLALFCCVSLTGFLQVFEYNATRATIDCGCLPRLSRFKLDPAVVSGGSHTIALPVLSAVVDTRSSGIASETEMSHHMNAE